MIASPAGTVTPPTETSDTAKRSGSDAMDGCTRSVSSITASQPRSPARTAASCAGSRSRATTALPMRLTVVSKPAPITSNRVYSNSSSLSRSPSSSRTRISSVVMSSPGSARLRAISPPRTAPICSCTNAACSGLGSEVSMMAAISRAASSRMSSGTPISSQMIRIGSGCANRARRSTVRPSAPAAAMPSSSSAVTVSTRGRIASVRRWVKLGATSLRSRVWSAP